MQTRLLAALTAAALGGAGTAAVNAAEWKIDPRVSLRAGYNDNIRLEIDDEKSSPEIGAIAGSRFSYETPRSGASGDLSFEVRRFPEESDFDDEIGRLNLRSFYGTERSRLGFDALLVKDTTLDSQLEESGVTTFERVDRWRATLNPNWSYSLSERSAVRLGYTYTDVNYDDNGDASFSDYTTNGGEVTLSHVLSPRTTASITGFYEQTDNDNDIESTYSGARAGASYKLGETLTASLFAGVRRSEVKATQNTFVAVLDENNNFILVPVSSGTQDDDLGYTFSGALDKEFLRGSMGISASRDVTSTVSGLPLEVTRLGWRGAYNFTEILGGELLLSYYHTESPNGIENREREYYQIEPRFNWRFREFWTLSGSYRYREQTFSSSNDEAVQNAAYLTLSYDWPRIAVSR